MVMKLQKRLIQRWQAVNLLSSYQTVVINQIWDGLINLLVHIIFVHELR